MFLASGLDKLLILLNLSHLVVVILREKNKINSSWPMLTCLKHDLHSYLETC